MKRLFPHSLLHIILMGNLLVALPLLIAIVYVLVTIGQLTERGATLTRESALAARLGHEVLEDLSVQDRLLRQHEVLGDDSLLDDYGVARREWLDYLNQFARIPLLDDLVAPLQAVLLAEDQAYATNIALNHSVSGMIAALVEQRSHLVKMVDEAGRISERKVAEFRLQVDAVRKRLWFAMLLAIVFLSVLAIFARPWLQRVLQGFEKAVHSLGDGKLDQPIRLSGPADIQELGMRLEWLRCRLRALEDQRTRVLRHVSHELKTPLAAMREGASLLSERATGPLTDGQERIVTIMGGNALRLQRLIDGLLKLQQAGHAGEQIEPVRVRFDELVRQVVTTHQLAARGKQVQFVIALQPVEVFGGHEELTTMVNNLVANAIKFSPMGGSIDLQLQREAESVILEIGNQGEEVPQEDRDAIFEPFFRSKSAKNVAGEGLGLAIAREFALAHRGSLVLLEKSPGTWFRLTLPSSSVQ